MAVRSKHALAEFFTFEHLRPDLREVSQKYCEFFEVIDEMLEEGTQKDLAVQRLLDSKDAAVRARLKEVNDGDRED